MRARGNAGEVSAKVSEADRQRLVMLERDFRNKRTGSNFSVHAPPSRSPRPIGRGFLLLLLLGGHDYHFSLIMHLVDRVTVSFPRLRPLFLAWLPSNLIHGSDLAPHCPPCCLFQGVLFAFDGVAEKWKRRHFRLEGNTVMYTQALFPFS